MIELNLIPENPAEQRIKNYLEENASDVLTDKINNGVKITKNGLTLINKKTLKGFMKYASDEARKTAKKSAYACIEDNVVYGWSIHYFEEDSIEEKLYNQDGTEYKPNKTKPTVKNNSTTTTATSNYAKPEPKKENTQFSIFDMLSQTTEQNTETKEETEQETTDAITKKTVNEQYTKYMKIKENYTDCILLYRKGDFYEILNQDAITCSKELDLTLTSIDYGLEEKTTLVGIPYHAADSYIAKLVQKGYKVAIAENLENENAIRKISNDSYAKQEKNINEETGEIINDENQEDNFDPDAFDTEALTILIEEFDGKIVAE